MFRTPHIGHPRHDDRPELATVQMPPPSLFVIVNLHPLLTLRASPEGVGKTDPHLDFPLLGLQGHALHPPRFHQTQNLLIKLEVFHAWEVHPATRASATMQYNRTSAAERSEIRREAVRPLLLQDAPSCPSGAPPEFHSKSSFVFFPVPSYLPIENHRVIPEEPICGTGGSGRYGDAVAIGQDGRVVGICDGNHRRPCWSRLANTP